jgi:hypothetical protein
MEGNQVDQALPRERLMSKKICIVSQSHLCRNPRVLKESMALSYAGYEVIILTSIYSQELLNEDLSLIDGSGIKYIFYNDLRKFSLAVLKTKAVKKVAVFLQSRFGIESKYSLGHNANRLRKICTSLNADLYIMHQELAMVIGSKMASTYPMVFDLEDWYSEDLLEASRERRPIKLLKASEKSAVETGRTCYTTSIAMANGLKDYYKTKQLPQVIYNSFSLTTSLSYETKKSDIMRLYWFSQTIGPGRGLEIFIKCLAKSNAAWELTLRGNINSSYHHYLTTIVSPKDKLVILPLLPNGELLKDMTRYDFGLALEPNVPQNKNLTISNKFFHYMAAGLPIIASDTLGQQEIGNKHKDIIFLYKNDDEGDLIQLLNKIGPVTKEQLNEIKHRVIDVYKSNYSWEIESQKLTQLLKNVIEQDR